MKSRIFIVCSILLLAFFSSQKHIASAAGDAFDLNQATITGSSPKDVASWPITTTLSVTLTPDNTVYNFDKRDGAWILQTDLPGFTGTNPDGTPEGLTFTEWLFVNVNGQWVGSGFIQMWTGRPDNFAISDATCSLYYDSRWAPMTSYQFKAGEQLGFMVTAGDARNGNTDLKERSNVVLMPAPADATDPSTCPADNGSSGGTTGSGGPDSGVVVPDLTSSGVTALSGQNPSLAFDPAKKLWLVVSENGGKIQGQLMTDTNKKSGSVLSIGGSDAHTPKVAYAPGINKFLVVWTSGKDPSSILWGQLVSEDGSASGATIKIATGGAHLYSAGNIQYDSAKQSFVLTYEKAGNGTSVMIAGISGSGAIIGPTKLADISLQGSAPAVAINTKTHEYCATYLDADKIEIQPVSADGTVGSATELGQGNGNAGIIYSSADGTYTAAWHDKNNSIPSKTLNTCADDPTIISPASLGDGVQAGILVQNTGGFGLFSIDAGGTSDNFTSFDSSGNGSSGQTIFAGTWSGAVLWPAVAPNPVTGMYAAVASPDGKTVKFVSGIGTPFTGPINNGPIPASRDFPVPSQGLPTDLGQLISAIFVWSLSIIGLVIFVRFFYAGFLWFTAAGNAANVGKAKDIMKNAVYGALVLFSAWLILNTINPDLVGSTLKLQGIPATNPTAGSSKTSGASGASSAPTSFCVDYVCSANATSNAGQPCGTETDCGGTDKVCQDGFCTNTGASCTGESGCIEDSGPSTQYDCSATSTCVAAPGGVGTYPDLATCQRDCEGTTP